MKKLFTIMTFAIMATLLIACGSNNDNGQSPNYNEPENAEVNNNESNEEIGVVDNEENESQNNEDNSQDDGETNDEISEANKEELLRRYERDLRIGDSQEWERSDGLGTDHIEFTVNSFKLVDDIDGEEPKNDHFLLVNVTVENLLDDYNYGINFLKSIAEGREGGTIQNERGDLSLELEGEDGISTGDVVFDVYKSDYYRVSFFDAEFYLLLIDEQSAD